MMTYKARNKTPKEEINVDDNFLQKQERLLNIAVRKLEDEDMSLKKRHALYKNIDCLIGLIASYKNRVNSKDNLMNAKKETGKRILPKISYVILLLVAFLVYWLLS